MPKAAADHSNGSKPEPDSPRFMLSGDYGSPAEVLASTLDPTDKRELLLSWKAELERLQSGSEDQLLEDVCQALAKLDQEHGDQKSTEA